MEKRIGFIGAGNMSEALMKGIIDSGIVEPGEIIAGEIIPERRDYITQTIGVETTADNILVARSADLIVLGVKPQYLPQVLGGLRPHLNENHLVISIAAGIRINFIESCLKPGVRVIRVMPNQPLMVRATAAGYAMGTHATKADAETVQEILDSNGIAYCLPEHLLDAVTGLSGSGPAFVYVIIEALADGGVLAGLPRDVAISLAAQTVLGSAKSVLDTKKHPGALKDMVASPAGTTIEGLQIIESAGVRGALMEAVEAAARRSKELGEKG
ncbi:MAG TPA: pyrroline-5-carboxylate reductase [Methanomassiliicoccales archaeon]|nr:pyrroline-5-carboxylate reductase [Methanomassiliicoccales archaeon]